jgi:hypothetical protein
MKEKMYEVIYTKKYIVKVLAEDEDSAINKALNKDFIMQDELVPEDIECFPL